MATEEVLVEMVHKLELYLINAEQMAAIEKWRREKAERERDEARALLARWAELEADEPLDSETRAFLARQAPEPAPEVLSVTTMMQTGNGPVTISTWRAPTPPACTCGAWRTAKLAREIGPVPETMVFAHTQDCPAAGRGGGR